MGPRRSLSSIGIGTGLALLVVSVSTPAEAIPVFSRKYNTSCATCHVAFPKLNAFGKAFRNNGYRMPGGDEDYLKDENVKLGADPWRRLWPDAIWPSDIPYLPPVAFLIDNEAVHEPDATIKTDFRTPNSVALLTAGTLGGTLSWFGRVNLVAPGAPTHVHRLYAQFNGLFGSSLVNVRLGQMEPAAVPFSSNLRLTRTDYLMNTATFPLDSWVDYLSSLGDADEDENDGHELGDHDDVSLLPPGLSGGHGHAGGSFALSTPQQGLELYGAVSGFGGSGGFEYAVGVVNGNGSGDFAATGFNDNNSAKDLYWRASYKIGGMSVLGDPESAPAVTNNWQDNSIRIGAFGYHGKAPFLFGGAAEGADHDMDGMFRVASAEPDHDDDHEMVEDPAGMLVDEDFTRIGGDIDIWWGRLNLYGAYMWGKTEMSPRLLHDAETDFNVWFAQADYVLYPWLVGSLRYERGNYPGPFRDIERWVPSVTALIRANVKATFDAALYNDEELGNSYRFTFDFAF